MKKLSKISLLGELDILSKAELKQLVGSKTVTCESRTTEADCKKAFASGESCVAGNNGGTSCSWSGSFCICNPGPYGGLTNDYSYSYGYGYGGHF